MPSELEGPALRSSRRWVARPSASGGSLLLRRPTLGVVGTGAAHARLRAGHRDADDGLVLEHKHPDDRREVKKTIDDMLISRRPFSTRHRIVDTHGTVHQVVVVGDQLTDDEGAVIGTHGYYVDIRLTSDRAREEIITARVEEITEHRAVIEQAKGMLMLVYGLDEDAAFDLLRWRSQSSNVKLRRLAEIVIERFRNARDDAITSRSAFDHALLSGDAAQNGDGAACPAAN